MEEIISRLRRFTPLIPAAAMFLLMPGRAAEPDPKAVHYTLPDRLSGGRVRPAIRQDSRRSFEARHLYSSS